jgi:leucyl aminopeptidase
MIHLEYTGEGNTNKFEKSHKPKIILGEVERTLMLVGKGVVYDTGGADLKTGGSMPGMHRDKGGAAVVAGFFRMLAILQPRGLRVVGRMSMVRNSIGAEVQI